LLSQLKSMVLFIFGWIKVFTLFQFF
jgi:hypothetical protein